MLKRLFAIVSLVSMVNLFALVGLVGFLVSKGKLNRERASLIVDVLRGEALQKGEAGDVATSQPVAPEASGQRIARGLVQEEMARLQGDRVKREIADRQSLLRSAMLELIAKEEEIANRETQLAGARKKLRDEEQDRGFKKNLVLLSSIKSENAKIQLQAMKQPDAVRFFLEMETDVGKKIIDKCTTPDDRQWIGRILDQIRNRDVLRAEALETRANKTKR